MGKKREQHVPIILFIKINGCKIFRIYGTIYKTKLLNEVYSTVRFIKNFFIKQTISSKKRT